MRNPGAQTEIGVFEVLVDEDVLRRYRLQERFQGNVDRPLVGASEQHFPALRQRPLVFQARLALAVRTVQLSGHDGEERQGAPPEDRGHDDSDQRRVCDPARLHHVGADECRRRPTDRVHDHRDRSLPRQQQHRDRQHVEQWGPHPGGLQSDHHHRHPDQSGVKQHGGHGGSGR